jgi:hypothetical protein
MSEDRQMQLKDEELENVTGGASSNAGDSKPKFAVGDSVVIVAGAGIGQEGTVRGCQKQSDGQGGTTYIYNVSVLGYGNVFRYKESALRKK